MYGFQYHLYPDNSYIYISSADSTLNSRLLYPTSYYSTPLGCFVDIKTLLTEVNEESERVGLKVNIQKTKITASSPITSWKIDGETMETVRDYSLGFNITADGEYSHEIKRCLLLQRKAVTNLHSIIKSRDMTLPTKVSLIKVIVFPVVMYGCESWTIKKLSTEKLMLLNCGFGEDS